MKIQTTTEECSYKEAIRTIDLLAVGREREALAKDIEKDLSAARNYKEFVLQGIKELKKKYGRNWVVELPYSSGEIRGQKSSMIYFYRSAMNKALDLDDHAPAQKVYDTFSNSLVQIKRAIGIKGIKLLVLHNLAWTFDMSRVSKKPDERLHRISSRNLEELGFHLLEKYPDRENEIRQSYSLFPYN